MHPSGRAKHSHDRVDVDITAKVPRQVAEVRALLDDRSHVDGLVPPCGLGNRLVSARLRFSQDTPVFTTTAVTHVSRVRRHDGQVVVVDDLLHLLNAAEVSQHVSDRDDVSILDQLGRDLLRGLDRSSSDGLGSVRLLYLWTLISLAHLLNEVGRLGEELDQLELEVSALGGSASVRRRASNNNSAARQRSLRVIDRPSTH